MSQEEEKKKLTEKYGGERKNVSEKKKKPMSDFEYNFEKKINELRKKHPYGFPIVLVNFGLTSFFIGGYLRKKRQIGLSTILTFLTSSIIILPYLRDISPKYAKKIEKYEKFEKDKEENVKLMDIMNNPVLRELIIEQNKENENENENK